MTSQILFDRLAYVDRLKAASFTEQQARGAADALGEALTETVATKADIAQLDSKFAQVETRIAESPRNHHPMGRRRRHSGLYSRSRRRRVDHQARAVALIGPMRTKAAIAELRPFTRGWIAPPPAKSAREVRSEWPAWRRHHGLRTIYFAGGRFVSRDGRYPPFLGSRS